MTVKCLSRRDWPYHRRIHAKFQPFFLLCWVGKSTIWGRMGTFLPSYCCCILSCLRYDIRWWIDEKFRAFLRIMVIWWLSECSWRSSSRISRAMTGKLEVALDPHKPSSLHGKLIKQQPLIYSSVGHARGIAIVVLRYMTKRFDGEKYFCSGRFWQYSVEKSWNGHRLAIVGYFSRGELSSSPSDYIRAPFDEKFRGVLSKLDAPMATWMLVGVGGGIFPTKFLALNCSRERLAMPKNVLERHQTRILYSDNELILKGDVYLP